MLRNKLYDYLHKYLAEYLFGFDKSQLEVAILSGQIDLKDVNVRPDKVNEALQAMRAPFVLKAGMIGKLRLEYSLLSFLSNPFSVSVDDVQIILGPNTSLMSQEPDPAEDQQDQDESYDTSNCFNIFTHQIKFAVDRMSPPPEDLGSKKRNGKKKAAGQEQPKEGEEQGVFQGYAKNILKNIKLSLNHLHIRYEDDYFSSQKPFAFGLLCDQVVSYGTETEWHFDALESNQFRRVRPTDADDLIVRETNAVNVRVYWKSYAEMIVPLSLWESTKHLEKQIFEAISLEDMRNMMKQSFADDNLVEPFSVYTSFSYNTRPSAMTEALEGRRKRVRADILMTKISVTTKPNIVEDIGNFAEYTTNMAIMRELKNYRPARRPILKAPSMESEKFKRKRLLVSRDWFFYAIWATRIKNAIRAVYSSQEEQETKRKELRQLRARLSQKMQKLQGAKKSRAWYDSGSDAATKDELSSCLNMISGKLKTSEGSQQPQEEDEEDSTESLWGVQLTFRCQSMVVCAHGADVGKRNGKPVIEFQVQAPCASLSFGRNSVEAAFLVGEFRAFDYAKFAREPSKKAQVDYTAVNSFSRCTPNSKDLRYRSEAVGSTNVQKCASFARSPISRPSEFGHNNRLLTESKESNGPRVPAAAAAGFPRTLASLSATFDDEASCTSVKQSCFALLQGKSQGACGLRLILNLADVPEDKDRCDLGVKGELGNLTVEVHDRVMEALCELLAPYRELYWFRDFPQADARPKAQRGVVIGKVNSRTKDNIITETQIKRIKQAAHMGSSCDKLDSMLAEKDLNVGLSWENVSLALMDPSSEEPVSAVTMAPGSLRVTKKGERCSVTAFGLTVTTARSLSLTACLKMKTFVDENSLTGLVRDYRERYAAIIRQRLGVEKESTHCSGNSKASEDDLSALGGGKMAAILRHNMDIPKLAKRMANKLHSKVSATSGEAQESACPQKRPPDESDHEPTTKPQSRRNSQRAGEWRKLVLRGNPDIGPEAAAESDVPIPLTNGENRTNVRLSEMNEKILKEAGMRRNCMGATERPGTMGFASKSHVHHRAINFAETDKDMKENNVIDLSEEVHEPTPKANRVMRFPTFSKLKGTRGIK